MTRCCYPLASQLTGWGWGESELSAASLESGQRGQLWLWSWVWHNRQVGSIPVRERAGLFSRETQPDNSPANYVLYQYQPSSAAVCSVQQQGTRESAGKKSWCSRCCALSELRVLDWRPLEDTISLFSTINKWRKLHSLSSPSFLCQFEKKER